MKKIFLILGFGILLTLVSIQCSSAYYSYNYYPRSGYGEFSLSFKKTNFPRYHGAYYWDNEDLKWRKDPIQNWIDKGDTWRERVKRARAVNFLIDSWDSRYAIASGKTTEQVFSKDANDAPAKSYSNWRYKEAYDPLVHGTDSTYNYYYKPRYDYQSQTYNWRY